MNYEDHIEAAINRLHEEGRYRTFIDIERERGNFPTQHGNRQTVT